MSDRTGNSRYNFRLAMLWFVTGVFMGSAVILLVLWLDIPRAVFLGANPPSSAPPAPDIFEEGLSGLGGLLLSLTFVGWPILLWPQVIKIFPIVERRWYGFLCGVLSFGPLYLIVNEAYGLVRYLVSSESVQSADGGHSMAGGILVFVILVLVILAQFFVVVLPRILVPKLWLGAFRVDEG